MNIWPLVILFGYIFRAFGRFHYRKFELTAPFTGIRKGLFIKSYTRTYDYRLSGACGTFSIPPITYNISFIKFEAVRSRSVLSSVPISDQGNRRLRNHVESCGADRSAVCAKRAYDWSIWCAFSRSWLLKEDRFSRRSSYLGLRISSPSSMYVRAGCMGYRARYWWAALERRLPSCWRDLHANSLSSNWVFSSAIQRPRYIYVGCPMSKGEGEEREDRMRFQRW